MLLSYNMSVSIKLICNLSRQGYLNDWLHFYEKSGHGYIKQTDRYTDNQL